MDRVEIIKSWYEDCLKRIQTVHSIFIDTFGEDKVDLQWLEAFESFSRRLSNLKGPVARSYLINFGFPATVRDVNFYSFSDLSDEELESRSDLFRTLTGLMLDAEILIYFPEVIIKNEKDQQHTIKKFYVKVTVDGRGILRQGPLFNRAKYTKAELNANYMHSHIYGPNKEDFSEFQTGCLGTGPINDTMALLRLDFAEDRWIIFANQIDQYVHVESLSGGPYHHLSSIGTNSSKLRDFGFNSFYFVDHLSTVASFPTILSNEDFQAFTEFLCDHFSETGLFIAYSDGLYTWGTPAVQTLVTISNFFIEWYNSRRANLGLTYQDLLKDNVLLQAVQRNGSLRIYYLGESVNTDYSSLEGADICTFKGERVTLEIESAEPSEPEEVPNSIKVLHPSIVESIVKTIPVILNLSYEHSLSEAQGHIYQV